MAKTSSDQRGTRRFTLKLPITVKLPDGQRPAQTRDVSARGVYFFVDSEITEGSPLEFTLTLPPEITLTESINVHCTGKVVRVHEQKSGVLGIAAAIDQYELSEI